MTVEDDSWEYSTLADWKKWVEEEAAKKAEEAKAAADAAAMGGEMMAAEGEMMAAEGDGEMMAAE